SDSEPAAGDRCGSAPDHRNRAERCLRVLGLPQDRRRLRRPLPERKALLCGRLDGAMRLLLAIAAAGVVALASAAPAAATGCDPIDPSRCLYPWPNDYFTEHGHLALKASMMPRNAEGTPIEPADYNWSDGFSPGAPIVTKVPGLDTQAAFART